jgi:hypothetical protein
MIHFNIDRVFSNSLLGVFLAVIVILQICLIVYFSYKLNSLEVLFQTQQSGFMELEVFIKEQLMGELNEQKFKLSSSENSIKKQFEVLEDFKSAQKVLESNFKHTLELNRINLIGIDEKMRLADKLIDRGESDFWVNVWFSYGLLFTASYVFVLWRFGFFIS